MRFTKVLLVVSLLALVVTPIALALRFTDESYNTPVGEVGKAYSFQFNGAGGCGPALPYQYRILDGSTPPGITMSSAGTFSGVPTQAGTWSFWVELSDQDPPSAAWCVPSKSQREFSIRIVQGIKIQQNALNPSRTFLNEPYSFQFTAQGGGPQTWSLISGQLPAGITLSSSGLLSGTPTAAGDFTFKVQVSDGSRTDTQTYTLSVVQRLKISTPAVPAGEVGLAFTTQLAATGGRGNHTWSLASGTVLPAGLTLDPATGVISGKPAAAGVFPVKVTVTDTIGLTDTVEVQLHVAAKLAIAKNALKNATATHAYKVRFKAEGGVRPRTWTILRGKLPAGITLNAKTGELSGKPTKAGTFRIRVQVTDKLGAKSQASFVLKVKA